MSHLEYTKLLLEIIDTQAEYIKLLQDYARDNSPVLQAHNIFPSPEVASKNKELREKMIDLKAKLKQPT